MIFLFICLEMDSAGD